MSNPSKTNGMTWDDIERQVQSIQHTRNILTGVLGHTDEVHHKPLQLRLFVSMPDGKKVALCKVIKVLGVCSPKSDDSYVNIFADAITTVDPPKLNDETINAGDK